MKQKIFSIFLLWTFTLICMKAMAYSFRVDGICYNITSSTDNTVGVTYFSYTETPYTYKGYTFYYRINVSGYSGAVVIPSSVVYNGITYTVTSIDSKAFSDYNTKTNTSGSAVTSITIPSTVTSISSDAFYTCTKMTKATVNSTSIPSFQYCTSLETISLGANSTGTVSLSSDLTSLSAINVDANNTVYSSVDGVLYNKAQTTLIRCPMAKSTVSIPYNTTAIGASAFESCKKITSISLPSNIKTLGSRSFYYCTGLKEVSFNSSYNLTSIGTSAFAGSGLESISIPYYVTTIPEQCFYNCSSLKEITFNSSYNLTSIDSYAFSNCSALESISFPSSLQTIGYDAFCYCTKLPLLNIPSSVTTISNYAFSGCTGLKHVIVNWSSSTSIPTITTGVFSTSTYSNAKLHSKYSNMVTYLKSKNYWSNFTTIDAYYEPSSYSSSYMDINSTSEIVYIGENFQLTATPMYSRLYEASLNEVIWSSSDPAVATVDQNGLVTAISRGTTKITAKKMYGYSLSATCDITVKYPHSLYMNNQISLAGSTPTLPVYMDNVKEICDLQFDIALPEGIDIQYGMNDDEEYGYFVSKGGRTKTAHTVTVNKLAERSYRIVISSPSHAVFKDTDKSLSIADITLTLSKTLAAGDYKINLTNGMLTNYANSTTTPIEVVDTSMTLTVPPPYTVTAVPTDTKMGTVLIEGSHYNASTNTTIYGDELTLTATPNTGYSFSKWTENSTTVSTSNPYSFTVTSDHDIKAVFTANQYTVTFLVDGVTYSSGKQTFGNVITKPTNPTKTGYTFTGWKDLTANMTVPANDVSFEAEFTINQYRVRFIADGVDVYNQLQDYNSDIVIPNAPNKDAYVFVTWGTVLDKVPANDVTYTADYALLGDVYEDGKINVADLTSLVGIILAPSMNVSTRTFKMADVYADSKINVADYTDLVGLIARADLNAKSDDDFPTEAGVANIQFDMVLPTGIMVSEDDIAEALQNTSLGRNHSVAANMLDDGAIRFVIVSPSNAVMKNVETVISNIHVECAAYIGEYDVTLRNLIFSYNNHTYTEKTEMTGKLTLGDTTGIDSVSGSWIQDSDAVYNLSGQKLNGLRRGVNIVNGKKIVKK